MDAIGAQELLFPALLPREPYEASGRWAEYGDNIFRLKDRKGADYLLGPTHEELFALTVKDLYSSYKDLPVTLYQIQNKYRDEARPRAGILRGREFVMKDAYSFDIDDAGLQKSYDQQREAYTRIFDRLGFHYVIVEAMAGAMGGSKSEEFLATAENGEDTYVRCPNCGYAANVEAVRVPVPPAQDWTDAPAAHVEDTPDTPTIATLVDHLNARFPRDDRALGGRRHAQERPRHWSPPRTAPRRSSPSASPETATSTRSAWGRSWSPSASPRCSKGLRRSSRAGQGVHRAGGARRRQAGRRALPRSTRASWTGTRWVTGANTSPGTTSSTSSPDATSPRRHHRGRRGARRRRVPELRARAGGGQGHRDGPHLPARQASTPRRSASRSSTRTASW